MKTKIKKQQIKQKIVATIIVFFMMIMVFGSRGDIFAANQTNTTLTQNLIQGTLQLEVSSTNLVFNDLTIGVGANSMANLTIVNARDYRGTGAGWTVSATMNNLMVSAAGQNDISNAAINWKPTEFAALDGGNALGVAIGAGGTFATAQTLINASTNNGMGNYKVSNTVLNVLYNGSTIQKAGMYQNLMTMTII